MKKNPLKNVRTMFKLNPYALTQKRVAKITEEKNKKKKEEILNRKRGVGTSDVSEKFVIYTLCSTAKQAL